MPRKPRDIEAELKALQEKARSLRSRHKNTGAITSGKASGRNVAVRSGGRGDAAVLP